MTRAGTHGEIKGFAVSLRTGASVSADELSAWCKEHLANNKVPRTFVIMDELPHDPNGKVLKKALKAPLQAAADARRQSA